jgi:hypothetical protein
MIGDQMTSMNQEKKKWGPRGNIVLTLVFTAIFIFFLFGGKGANTADLNGYATTYDANNPGSVKLFDIGARSKVAIIRHEDGSLTGLSFRKIPLLDRWKVTDESFYFEGMETDNVWISVDDGFRDYTVVSDGEILTDVANHGWYGAYARLLEDMAFVLLLSLVIEVGKKLWKRRQANKNAGALPE